MISIHAHDFATITFMLAGLSYFLRFNVQVKKLFNISSQRTFFPVLLQLLSDQSYFFYSELFKVQSFKMLRLMTCVTSDKPWGNTRSRSSGSKKNRERRRKKEVGENPVGVTFPADQRIDPIGSFE